MGKPKAMKAYTDLGFSFGPNPLKSKSILIFSLGPSATCSSSSPQEDYDGESGGERDVAGGPRSWSKLPTSRATSDMPNCTVFAAVFQRRHPGGEPAAAAMASEDGASSCGFYKCVRDCLGRTWSSGGEFTTCVADNAAAIEFL